MANRTLAQLRTYIKRDFKRTDKDTEIDDAVNDTILFMATNYQFDSLHRRAKTSCQVGREDYILPSGLQHIRHPLLLLDTTSSDGRAGSYPLDHISSEKYDELEPNPNHVSRPTGKPCRYCIRQGAVHLTPIPDRATLEILVPYFCFPTTLSANADVHQFTQDFEPTIKAGCLERLYKGLKMYDLADEEALNFLYGYYNPSTGERVGGWLQLTSKDKANAEPVVTVDPHYF
jgi:hypothetical protein